MKRRGFNGFSRKSEVMLIRLCPNCVQNPTRIVNYRDYNSDLVSTRISHRCWPLTCRRSQAAGDLFYAGIYVWEKKREIIKHAFETLILSLITSVFVALAFTPRTRDYFKIQNKNNLSLLCNKFTSGVHCTVGTRSIKKTSRGSSRTSLHVFKQVLNELLRRLQQIKHKKYHRRQLST